MPSMSYGFVCTTAGLEELQDRVPQASRLHVCVCPCVYVHCMFVFMLICVLVHVHL